jgi:hypothetical protein
MAPTHADAASKDREATLAMIDSDAMSTCIHEAAHCIAMLIVESHISEVVINGRSGHCRSDSNAPLPAWDSSVAAARCAVDFAGCIAMCRAYSLPLPESDADFEKHGGTGDLRNFRRRAAVLTNFDEAKTATLRARAIECALLIVDEYGRAIDAVADSLYVNGALDHAGVCRAVASVPEDAKYLLPKSRFSRIVTHGSTRRARDGSVIATRFDGGHFVTR